MMSTAQVRGIEHFGITEPDIDAATEFLVEAIGAKVIYGSYPKSRPPLEGEELEQTLNLAHGTKIVSVRVLKVSELLRTTRHNEKAPMPACLRRPSHGRQAQEVS
jgi:hypothetical protein